MLLKLAVFDMAGTTIEDDLAVTDAFCEAFAQHNISVSPGEVGKLMGYKKIEAIGSILKMQSIPENGLASRIYDVFTERMLAHYKFSDDVAMMPGTEEVFRALKGEGMKIALNTGFPRVVANEIVQRMGWFEAGLIDDYIASDEVDRGRPHPDMIHTLMQRLDISDPKEVVKIGDTEVDINEGKNAGCALVIGVTTGAFSRADLEPYMPDFIIDDLSELSALIKDFA